MGFKDSRAEGSSEKIKNKYLLTTKHIRFRKNAQTMEGQAKYTKSYYSKNLKT